MIDCILGKNHKLRQSQFVCSNELVCHIAERADSFVAQVGEVVEASFQLAFALLLGPFGNGLRRRF
jgi:hypothetical protein